MKKVYQCGNIIFFELNTSAIAFDVRLTELKDRSVRYDLYSNY